MSNATAAGPAAPTGDVRDVVADVGRHWGWLLAFGIVSVLLGISMLVWPHVTILVVAIFLGAYLLVSGIFQIVNAFTEDELTGGFRWLIGVSGFVSILLGLFAFRSIAHSLAILVLLIGFGFLIRGFSQLIDAIADRGLPMRGWHMFSGILGVLAGMVVLAYPGPSLVALTVVTGIWLIVLGVAQAVMAFQLRKLPA
jgi:uncharacterized membrane protein HdeD (DUF308 family)